MGLYELSMYPNGYNIYASGGSPENRAAFEKSLDKFIAANPKVGNIDTEMFRDFMIALADHESSFRSKVANNVGNYSGYYGLLNGSKMTEEEQHRAAYNHLKKIFTENMVKEDIVKASELGITPAQLLIKYWNQGNRVTNYLYNGKDSTDGLGTKVSEYGNDINLDLDYSTYLPSAITSDFVTVEKGKNSLSNAIKLARIPGMDYSNRESYITNLNKEYNKGFDSRKLQVGDMIWLVPKSDSEKQDAGNTPTKSNRVHFLEAPQGEYQVSPYNMPSFKNPYIPIQSIDLNTKEGFDNPILQYRVNTKATGGPLTKYDTKLPKEKEQAYAQWVESLPLNLRDDHDYDLRGAFLEGLKPDKYGHMSDKYKKPWHPTFSNESIYSTKDMQGGHWEGDEFVPSPWQEKRQQLINSMNLMEPNTFSNGGTIHIKPENKGKFTAAAKRAGKSVQGYASQILANPDNYSSTLVKRANFARNAAKWHACGGKLYPDGGPLSMDLRPAIPPQGEIIPGGVGLPQYYTPLYAESLAAYKMRERMKDYYNASLEDMLRASREKQMLNNRSDNEGRQSAKAASPGNYSTPPIVMPNFRSPYSIGQDYVYPDMNDPAIDPLKGTYSDFRTDSGAQVSERTPSAKTNTGSTNNVKSKVPAKQGETVAAMWSRITGLPWKKAKELGLTDGSYAANIDVLKNLKNGNYTKESINALVNKQYSDYDGPVYRAEPEVEDVPVDAGFYSEPPEILDMYDPVYPSNYDNHMAAYGGRFFRDGGPTDPPWMSFTPSKARSPQVVKPQPQVNPYLLGLASGSGRVNPSVQYTTVAQTLEFQQGMRDAEAAFASTAEFKDNTKGEEGARAVSPVLSVIPGTGDVKDFADIGEYYQNTGNLGNSLGMAAFTILSPVQGVTGKFGKWLSKPWKERGKFRKSFDIAAPLSAGIGGGAYVYDRVSTNNRNFTPSIDEQEWMEKDSVTLRNEALKNKSDSLEQVRMKQRYDYLISQGYSPEQALAILSGGAQYE